LSGWLNEASISAVEKFTNLSGRRARRFHLFVSERIPPFRRLNSSQITCMEGRSEASEGRCSAAL
jgi:hypothetical protein